MDRSKDLVVFSETAAKGGLKPLRKHERTQVELRSFCAKFGGFGRLFELLGECSETVISRGNSQKREKKVT